MPRRYNARMERSILTPDRASETAPLEQMALVLRCVVRVTHFGRMSVARFVNTGRFRSQRLGSSVKFFGHYISPLFVLLAGLDSALFFVALRLLSFSHHCGHCYFGTLVSLRFYQVGMLTGGFLLIAISVGLYNDDAFQDFRTFLRRFILGWQLIFIPGSSLRGRDESGRRAYRSDGSSASFL